MNEIKYQQEEANKVLKEIENCILQASQVEKKIKELTSAVNSSCSGNAAESLQLLLKAESERIGNEEESWRKLYKKAAKTGEEFKKSDADLARQTTSNYQITKL